ncbi:MAG: calcium/sodium antiporter, partial [Pseudomonadales bacterium]|nr:calcium/sodium antiporter [Pseudomonadales bacterium]
MIMPVVALLGGIALLIVSADKFVEGAAATAKRAGLPPLLIGMVIIGFGSSVPEMVISALSAWNGNPGLALGNAFGSNITNIALILGVTALLSPIAVRSSVLQRELPMLTVVTAVTAIVMYDDRVLSRTDGIILIGVFLLVMAWSVYEGLKISSDELADDVQSSLATPLSGKRAMVYLVGGLTMLVV